MELWPKKKRAQLLIHESEVLVHLARFSPVVVSTIFADLDTDTSDIDIVCTYRTQADFQATFQEAFQDKPGYNLKPGHGCVIGRFKQAEFTIEVYASSIPSREQLAYRHFVIMQRLSKLGGNQFQERVRALKRDGMKTEQAITKILGLRGDAHTSILQVAGWSNHRIIEVMSNYNPAVRNT